ncbi:MAG TPA: hypothetical protein VF332_09320 [Vicinamibacterales bacterium]|jgi:hypothetical protein
MAARKWIPIVVGIVIFVMVVGVGLVGGLIYVVTRQVNVQTMTAVGGQEEFDRLLASMSGQKPFIELPAPDSDGEVVVHRELETRNTGSISTLHIRVWSPRDLKLAHVDLPFWMMRLAGNKPIKINAGSLRDVTLTVTPEEIDRRGPGLILNWATRHGDRLLVWTE